MWYAFSMSDPSEAETAPALMARPALHLTAQEGWINDPVGLTYHQGLYHQFFQYVARTDRVEPGVPLGTCRE